jgi:hypothetical protein
MLNVDEGTTHLIDGRAEYILYDIYCSRRNEEGVGLRFGVCARGII